MSSATITSETMALVRYHDSVDGVGRLGGLSDRSGGGRFGAGVGGRSQDGERQVRRARQERDLAARHKDTPCTVAGWEPCQGADVWAALGAVDDPGVSVPLKLDDSVAMERHRRRQTVMC
jgi:hypothetical protein